MCLKCIRLPQKSIDLLTCKWNRRRATWGPWTKWNNVQGKCEDVTVSWASFLGKLLPSDQSTVFLSTLLMVREASFGCFFFQVLLGLTIATLCKKRKFKPVRKHWLTLLCWQNFRCQFGIAKAQTSKQQTESSRNCVCIETCIHCSPSLPS